ncbi:MAG: hypothetical protein HYU66_08810 [Armatimonadetes bacterium]|nr:hypothetical protein [Armatimonadota bacterium]
MMPDSTVREAVQRYLTAARRGVAWLLAQQQEDGSIGSPDLHADVYHKAGYAFGITGHPDAAYRLYDWIVRHDLQPDGALRHHDPGLALYKTNWTLQGALRMARFDLAKPVMRYVLTRQAPCGGFFQNATEERFIEPVCTAWAGVSAIYNGERDAAAAVVGCFASMLEQQPDADRFYYRMTPSGELITEGELAACLEAAKTRQAYYCPGIALLFLVRQHLATGDPAVLALAQRLFDATLRLGEDGYRYVTAAKGGVAAAILQAVTGDARALAAATSLGDYLAAEQTDEGWWANPYDQGLITRLDHTAEFICFLSETAANLAGAAAR